MLAWIEVVEVFDVVKRYVRADHLPALTADLLTTDACARDAALRATVERTFGGGAP